MVELIRHNSNYIIGLPNQHHITQHGYCGNRLCLNYVIPHSNSSHHWVNGSTIQLPCISWTKFQVEYIFAAESEIFIFEKCPGALAEKVLTALGANCHVNIFQSQQFQRPLNITIPIYTLPGGILPFLFNQSPATTGWVFQSVKFTGDFGAFENACQQRIIQLQAVSDGSFKDSHGTASWRISISYNADNYICGSTVAPGPPVCQSAY